MATIDDNRLEHYESLMLDPAFVKKMRFRASFGALVGTTVEWYEYFIYGSTAALVFPALFFPGDNEFVSTMLSFATFAVAFVVRPLGGAFFGRIGDRLGRKKTLIITLLVTGVATVLVGVLPTYATLGVAAPLMLLTLRVVQGFGVGGEWGSSVLMSMEWGEAKKPGLTGAWPQMGSPLGLITASGAVALMTGVTTAEQYEAWGWRVPFLFAGVLATFGLVIRLRMTETPVFMRHAAPRADAKNPVSVVVRKFPKELVLSAFLRLSEQAPFYIFTVYVLHYIADHEEISGSLVLAGVMTAAAIDLVLVPVFGHLADTVGRREMYYIGCVALAVYAVPYFWALDTGNPTLVFFAVTFSLLPHALQYGSQSSLIAEQFPAEVRASGASIGYQLASIVAGGPAPMIATALVAYFASGFAVAVYLVVCAALAAVALRLMPRRSTLADAVV